MNSTSTPTLFPRLDLSSNIGTGYWGLLGASVLLGCTVLQAYFYFRNNNDGWRLRGLVISLCALDTISWALFVYVYYHYLVQNFDNILVITAVPWPFGTELFVASTVTLLSQLFFARQIYGGAFRAVTCKPTSQASLTVNEKCWAIPVVIVVLAVVAFGSCKAPVWASALVTVSLWRRSTYPTPASAVLAVQGDTFGFILSKTVSIPTDINKASATACDIIATIAMCFILSRARTAISRTRSIVALLIIYITNRAILLALFQSADLLLYACAASQDYWCSAIVGSVYGPMYRLPVHMCLSKIYVNTLLAMLNARPGLNQSYEVSTIILEEAPCSSEDHSAWQLTFANPITAYEPSPRPRVR
ncbi:hypothetical protein HYDPIDRAFT_33182 [Hydnomerulius pinastri MD-312]|uniref:DUF6534 domain-containing protein n=1 Tax=Hydnomerulius pinastri MD-312 TaxID=994086 RepID=A0A0C9VP75_9AGAM|nr:hypothetical protein HYDPIDRAFT_33182 [Hydnomerulius pinastri MD-312]